jgi:CelD/BcsL family acetyltransferase involved in cellulose biosynthesis
VLKAEIVHPSKLTAAEVAAWSRMQAQAPGLGNPLLGPGFALAVGNVRPDARVAIWREGRRASGFMGFHHTAAGFARPIGAPFSDYQALVSRPAFPSAFEALEAAGLNGMGLTGLIDPHEVFPGDLRPVIAHRIDLSRGADAYLAALWEGSGNRWRNYKRYSRRMAEELGPLSLRAPDPSSATFETLFDWKRRQLSGTGLHDFTATPWIRELMRRLFETTDEAFGGLLVSLYAGDRPVAAHFGVRQGGWYHPWLGAFDPDLAGFSPGIVHQVLAAAAAAEIGIGIYDLGPRADRSKAMFANLSAEVGEGVAVGASLPAALVVRSGRLLSRGFVEHARKRWDHISAVEQTFAGRLAGLARAAGSIGRRVGVWSKAA